MTDSSLRARVHALGKQLVSEHASPARLAAAVWIGVVVGFTPLFGLHLWICLALAFVLRLNKVVLYAAANVSIPPMIPVLGFISVQVGERLLHGQWHAIGMSAFRGVPATELAASLFVDWLVGGLAVGAVIGAIAALLTLEVVRAGAAFSRGGEAVRRAIAEASGRYAAVPRRFSVYAWMKYRMDPCYAAVAALVPPNSLTVDLGTGLGMLPMVVALLGDGRRALGIDWDSAKLGAARQAARDLSSIELREGDLRTAALPPCDRVVLIDVLHYYAADEQRAILGRCRDALNPGGALIVRDSDARRGGGAWFTRTGERLARLMGWNRGPSVTFRGADAFRDDLVALGFTVRVDEVSGPLHPGNVLLIATR